ncbi:pancreas/duodenum homeobox protein 1 [Thermodesulfobacteriota bacterium]
MTTESIRELFSLNSVKELFPAQRTEDFFEALFGDAAEGAFDISLAFNDHHAETKTLQFELHLTERPGRCLSCNLTYGLPEVFSRHPVINIQGLVADIDKILDGRAACGEWKLGATISAARDLHIIPLIIQLQ